jgi:hypothetical protein
MREEHWRRAFESRVLRNIFGPQRDERTGEWRRLHTEELCDLYYSPNISRVIKSRMTRWTGHVAHMPERRGAHRISWGNLRKRDHLKELVVDGGITLKFIFKELDARDMDWTDLAKAVGLL